uniref:Sugar transporter SWEET1 n=1 Tax=Saccharum spontaneum TaxID=62335 RepID=A0A3G5AXU2_SACSP|nr:SWEET4d [Saccharum spontaneum]
MGAQEISHTVFGVLGQFSRSSHLPSALSSSRAFTEKAEGRYSASARRNTCQRLGGPAGRARGRACRRRAGGAQPGGRGRWLLASGGLEAPRGEGVELGAEERVEAAVGGEAGQEERVEPGRRRGAELEVEDVVGAPPLVSASSVASTIGDWAGLLPCAPGGNITSGLLFLSPVPTFLDIRSHESTEQYSANAYLAALLNCAIWVLYGLVQPQGALLVVSINTIGVLMEFFYVACFLYYSADELRHKVVWMLVGAMLFVAVIFTLVFSLADTPEHKSMGFGLVGIATGIGMYAAPVINLKSVIDTGNVESMSLLLIGASLGNSTVWTVYALIGSDLFVLIPNLLGMVFTGLQLCVYFRYSNNA